MLSVVAIVFIVTATIVFILIGFAVYQPCKEHRKQSNTPLMENIYP